MSGVDASLVDARLVEIKRLLGEIERTTDLGVDTFLVDADVRDATKYRLLVAIEAAISVCNHIVTREMDEIPATYSECFALLGRHGVVPEDLAERLAQMARFRNVLIHRYWKVDDRRVYEFKARNIQDLYQFVEKVREHVHGTTGDSRAAERDAH
ncbi:MAG: DUF86 domain-containing protein [Candidatus Thorarchaeota archaeon]|nr:MAG: DUF86 domain-containing protein [Candidatus Thorarchaeota archaeon]